MSVFTIEWSVIGHVNQAGAYTFPLEVDVFVREEGDTAFLLVEDDWLREHRGDSIPENAEFVKYEIDGTEVDPENVFEHPRISRP